MLKNYFEIDQEENVRSFLKDLNEKKNMQYIILDTNPPSFVDMRTIALRAHHPNERLKSLKKPLSETNLVGKEEVLFFLIESGERVVKTRYDYYDFLNALSDILEAEHDFLSEKIEEVNLRKEIYALNENDMISNARELFVKKRVNLLPVIKNYNVIGEVRIFDLLVNDLFDKDKEKSGFYDEKMRTPVLNLPVSNIVNYKPLVIDKSKTIRDAIETMIRKRLASLIVVDGEELFSVISYKDIFKFVRQGAEKTKYHIEYVGGSDLYDDEFDMIQDYCEKTMKKVSKMSKYDNLKVSFKVHGNQEGSHQKKISVKYLLSYGNHVINVDKEIVGGTSGDEDSNDKVKGAWNVPQIVQEGLVVLEKKVKEERGKK